MEERTLQYAPDLMLKTYMRIDIPSIDYAAVDKLGVVLVVEGGLPSDYGVQPSEEEEENNWFYTRSRLASGMGSYSDPLIDPTVEVPPPYRNGDPMVDTEGPSNSIEACGAYNAWDVTDTTDIIDPAGAVIGWDMPTDLSWDKWKDGVNSGAIEEASFDFWYRPPTSVERDPALGTDGDAFWDRLAGRLDAEGEPYGKWFKLLTEEHWDPTAFKYMVRRFWKNREPHRLLESIVAAGTAYLRIQGATNHSPQPDWYMCRNAVRNLNAAHRGGPCVFIADYIWMESYAVTGDASFPPRAVLLDYDPDHYVEGDWPTWYDPAGADAALPFTTFFFTMAWQVQVNLVRWAFVMDFP